MNIFLKKRIISKFDIKCDEKALKKSVFRGAFYISSYFNYEVFSIPKYLKNDTIALARYVFDFVYNSYVFSNNGKQGAIYSFRSLSDISRSLFKDTIRNYIKNSPFYYEMVLKTRRVKDKHSNKTLNVIQNELTEAANLFVTRQLCCKVSSFRLSYGIPLLEDLHTNYIRLKNEVIQVKPEEVFFPIPQGEKLNSFNEMAISPDWKAIGQLFDIEYREASIKGLILWTHNIILSYHGKKRLNPIFPILSGKQGIGKDNVFFRKLTEWIPDIYIIRKADASFIADERKSESFLKKLVANFPEMQNFSSTDKNKIKSFVTADSIPYRNLYSHHVSEVDNLTNLFGTTNEEELSEIFSDDSGERRFLFLKLRKDLQITEMKECINAIRVKNIVGMINIDLETESLYLELRSFMELHRAKSTVEYFIEYILPELEQSSDRIETKYLWERFLAWKTEGNFKYDKDKRVFGKEFRKNIEDLGYKYINHHPRGYQKKE